MGSTTFFTTMPGELTVENAWHLATEDDKHLNGHDGYTGGIGSVYGYNMHTPPQRLTKEQARDYADDRIESLPHWGKRDPAEVIPFYEETPGRYGKSREKTVELKVTADNSRWWSHHSNTQDPGLIAELVKRGLFKKGEIEAVSISVVEPLPPQIENLSTSGAAVTKYFITASQMPYIHTQDWSAGYTSMSDAREALNTLVASGRVSGAINIVAKTARADGTPLVQMKVTQMTKFTVKVTWRKELDAPQVSDQREGWLFYGWAAE